MHVLLLNSFVHGEFFQINRFLLKHCLVVDEGQYESWWCAIRCGRAITTIWRHLLLLPPSASLPSPNWGQARCLGTGPHATVAPRGSHMASRSPNCQALGRPATRVTPTNPTIAIWTSSQRGDTFSPTSQYRTCSTGHLVG